MEELRQKLETVQNAAETDQRQLVQSNEDIENLKKKLEETEKNVSEKDASLRTSKYTRVPWTALVLRTFSKLRNFSPRKITKSPYSIQSRKKSTRKS